MVIGFPTAYPLIEGRQVLWIYKLLSFRGICILYPLLEVLLDLTSHNFGGRVDKSVLLGERLLAYYDCGRKPLLRELTCVLSSLAVRIDVSLDKLELSLLVVSGRDLPQLWQHIP